MVKLPLVWNMPMLVATAGHIDHGKTSLIRALTGVETDRLPEEKARGISIDLGFAYWRPDDGATIGFVDVPGHERYVRNMMAGLSGIRRALLVVAADDGVMPQTIEHLRILDLLGFDAGMVALSKCDRVPAARIAQLGDEIAALLGETSLAGAAVYPVSAVTGDGIATLAAALVAARDEEKSFPTPGLGFRMAIDRAFSVAGAGTVVTGTVLAGHAAIGDELAIAPAGRRVRVRGIQSAGQATGEAAAGMRCALNLSGVEAGEVARGDWLTEPELCATSMRMQARVRLLPSAPAPLRHGAHVHLHIGTAATGARVLLPRQRALAPGDKALAMLVPDTPIHAVTGDRFILRDDSGRLLLGGGAVIEPQVQTGRRKAQIAQAVAEAFDRASPEEALVALVALAQVPGFDLDIGWFARAHGLQAGVAADMARAAGLLRFGREGRLAVAPAQVARLGERISSALAAHHAAHPSLSGPARRELRAALGEPVSQELFVLLLAELAQAGRIVAEGARVRLPGHVPSFSAVETAFWRKLLATLEDGALRPILLAELASELGSSEAVVAGMLQRRRDTGDVWQITPSRYMLREHVAQLAALAAQVDAACEGGFKAAQLRDASGLGRNFVIQLLEFFDRIGVTRRIGEARRMRGDWQAVTGPAEPPRGDGRDC